MKKNLLLLFLNLAALCACAQEYQWANAAGWIGQDAARAVAVDDEGNVYVAGQFGGQAEFDTIFITGNGTYDAFLAKYNSSGEVEWVNYAGGPNDDYGTGVCIDTEGFIYITGYYLDSIFFDDLKLESEDLHDIFIAKYSPAGDLVWAKSAGGRGEDRGYAITADPHGNIAIAGAATGTSRFGANFMVSAGDYDAFIAKYDNSGNCQWVKRGGGNDEDASKGISSDDAGNFFITGYIYGNTVFDTTHLSTTNPTSTDVFIAKYNQWGVFEWIRKCDSYLGDNPYGIATDWQGYSYITGYFQNETTFGNHTIYAEGYNDAFLAKYNPEGDCDWAKAIGGNDLDVGTSICVDDFGSVYLTGFFDSALVSQDTTYIAPGYEVFISKYWWNGDEIWTQIGGGGGNDFGNAIGVNKFGELAVAGYYNLYGYFGDFVLPLTQQQDIFVVKLSNTVGINDLNNNAFATVYPNPTQGEISFESSFEKNEPLTLIITDATGRVIFYSVEFPINNKLNIKLTQETANGIYFLNAYSRQQSFSGKIILNR